DADQTSVRKVAVTSVADAPASGKLPANLSMTLKLNLANGVERNATIRLTGAQTEDNSSLSQLVAQLQTVLDTELVRMGFDAGALAVSTAGGRLVIESTDDVIVSFSLANARALGFDSSTEPGTQGSVRSGDRLFFVSNGDA